MKICKSGKKFHKAEGAQCGTFGGKLAWSCIRDMQRCCRGSLPTRSATVKDKRPLQYIIITTPKVEGDHLKGGWL